MFGKKQVKSAPKAPAEKKEEKPVEAEEKAAAKPEKAPVAEKAKVEAVPDTAKSEKPLADKAPSEAGEIPAKTDDVKKRSSGKTCTGRRVACYA